MRLLYCAAIACLLAALQGCVPLVVAGVGAGLLVGTDRRPAGVYIDDEALELRAKRRISAEFGSRVHVDVNSFNFTALLTGEAPTEEDKAQIAAIVSQVPKVKRVVNEIRLAAPSSIGARASDGGTTTKVKARFVGERLFNPNHVKVVTEGGVVYLMGIVTREEGEDAAEVASGTTGVQKVVKVFEYKS